MNKKTIYHELGHVFGYVLSNKAKETSLGQINSMHLGQDKNCVIPVNLLYHSEKIMDDKDKIKINTSNIDRTIAWFIEVLLGCTFECEYIEYNFKDCFNSYGIKDNHNILSIRDLSYFKWDYNDIFDLQNKLKVIIEQDKIINKISPLVDKLLEEINTIDTNQLVYTGEDLEQLINDVNYYITDCLYSNYLDIISIFKLKFSQNIRF